MIVIDSFLPYHIPWEFPDVYLFTGNSEYTRDGRLVMGAGAAKAVRDAYPGIDREIRATNTVNFYVLNEFGQRLGYFKVKNRFKDPADLELIKFSTASLANWAEQFPDVRFHMNYPGVGKGGLSIEDVRPIVETLPDNVFLYL